jgi:tripartite-type tricarboxylate transporter receptor subunit TctC
MNIMLRVTIGSAIALALLAMPSLAQTWPSKSVKLIVPFPAGGSADTLSRIIGQELQNKTGQSFVVENRTGAGGNIGTDAVAKATPDGTTLLLTPSSIAIAPALYTKLTWDPVKDFEPVTLVGSIPMVVVVHPSFPAHSLTDLVAQAKARPGQINYASGGFGTTNHLAVELFKAQTGIDLVHVAYRGNPLAIVDVIGGHVPVFFDFVLTGAPHVRSGAVRALATTGAQRSSILPDVPTAMEAGISGFEASTWFGVYAPAGTPKDMVMEISKEVAAVLAMSSVKKRLADLGVEPMQGGQAALGELTKSDLAKWGPIIEKAGIKLE